MAILICGTLYKGIKPILHAMPKEKYFATNKIATAAVKKQNLLMRSLRKGILTKTETNLFFLKNKNVLSWRKNTLFGRSLFCRRRQIWNCNFTTTTIETIGNGDIFLSVDLKMSFAFCNKLIWNFCQKLLARLFANLVTLKRQYKSRRTT